MRTTQKNQNAGESSTPENEPKVLEFSKIEILCYKLIDVMDAKSYKKALWEMTEGCLTSPDADYLTQENRYHILSTYRLLSKFLKKIGKEVNVMKDNGVYIPIH